ncbi:hypothetical protein KB1_19220 [Cutibacterium modestum]|uniref:Uncharacterized protein n=1 Tax=Cutibacterium modestum TaxID=2559073 RepID=A0AAD1KQJ3_9ACTN|nr:hypothetical protein KB1_19220 [Cutibacterium modestum]
MDVGAADRMLLAWVMAQAGPRFEDLRHDLVGELQRGVGALAVEVLVLVAVLPREADRWRPQVDHQNPPHRVEDSTAGRLHLQSPF